MAGDWKPVFVLPNVPLLGTIGCDIAALAPAHDRRVTALKRAQPMFRRFLGRFSDNFSQKFEPAVLLVCADAPPSFLEVTTLASFRDLIAISTVAYNRALALRHPRGHRVMFGEAFAIYPWMLDKGAPPASLTVKPQAISCDPPSRGGTTRRFHVLAVGLNFLVTLEAPSLAWKFSNLITRPSPRS